MTDALAFLLAVLAVWRVAHMVAREDGPADAFARWRNAIGQSSWIGRGFHCVLCLSFWLALPAALYVDPDRWPLGWLGIAGGVLALVYISERAE